MKSEGTGSVPMLLKGICTFIDKDKASEHLNDIKPISKGQPL